MSASPQTPASGRSMLKIKSLLNPMQWEADHEASISPPLTPCLDANAPTPSSIFSSTTPTNVPKQKLVHQDTTMLSRPAVGTVNFAPFEGRSSTLSLSEAERRELARQHERFKVTPSGRTANSLISNSTMRIPYSSEKKAFSTKTGRSAFEVFSYTFVVPNSDDAELKQYTVMWDYQVGLVRITPFFKALGHPKTTPAKAINTNPGLKELCHSITGGSLMAQGYWIPYACARAICATFCWEIRWALTPVFGPAFVKECVRVPRSGSDTFLINGDIVYNSHLEAERFRLNAGGRSNASTATRAQAQSTIPRSAPAKKAAKVSKDLRPRKAKPVFKSGSPFDSGDDYSDGFHTSLPDSPLVSPKTVPRKLSAAQQTSGWTSVNPRKTKATPTSPFKPSLSKALLPKPTPIAKQNTSWRPAYPVAPDLLAAFNTCYPPKRRADPTDDEDDSSSYTSGGGSTPDPEELSPVRSPSPPPAQRKLPKRAKKEVKRAEKEVKRAVVVDEPQKPAAAAAAAADAKPKSTRFAVTEYHAAKALIQMFEAEAAAAAAAAASSRDGTLEEE